MTPPELLLRLLPTGCDLGSIHGKWAGARSERLMVAPTQTMIDPNADIPSSSSHQRPGHSSSGAVPCLCSTPSPGRWGPDMGKCWGFVPDWPGSKYQCGHWPAVLPWPGDVTSEFQCPYVYNGGDNSTQLIWLSEN